MLHLETNREGQVAGFPQQPDSLVFFFLAPGVNLIENLYEILDKGRHSTQE